MEPAERKAVIEALAPHVNFPRGHQNGSPHAPFAIGYWVQILLAWSTLATDMDSAQQYAASIRHLCGAAWELARSMNYVEMTQGGMVNRQVADAATYP